MHNLKINEAEYANIEQIHEYIAKVMHFPKYYGCNLSALNDCLSDVSEPTEISIRRSEKAPDTLRAQLDKMITVMKRAAKDNRNISVRVLDGLEAPEDIGTNDAQVEE